MPDYTANVPAPPGSLWGKARADHPATSHAAARAIAPAMGAQRARVLAAIRAAATGLTDEQGCDATGINPSAYRPRRVELAEAGLIYKAAVVRKTRSGRDACVWMAEEAK